MRLCTRTRGLGARGTIRLNRGFSLIELMIVVIIIGILAAIAYPSYRNYVTRTRRSDAQSALLQLANQQEKFFSECNYYATTIGGAHLCGPVGTATAALGLGALTSSPDGHYNLSVVAGNLTGATCSGGLANLNCGYTLIATPVATGLQAGNGKLRVDALGARQWDKADDNSYTAKWTDK